MGSTPVLEIRKQESSIWMEDRVGIYGLSLRFSGGVRSSQMTLLAASPLCSKQTNKQKIAHSYVDIFYHNALYLDMYLSLPLDSSRAGIILFIFLSLLHDTQ